VSDEIAVTRREAARRLGMSLDSFERHVQMEVELVRRGALVLVPVDELNEWVRKNKSLTLEADR
jgi:hypothetical protein